MKLYSCVLLFLSSLIFAQSTSDLEFDHSAIKKNGKYDIVDYFLLLPKTTFGDGLKNIVERNNALKVKSSQIKNDWGYDIIDKNNGYLRLSINGSNATEIVVWTKKNKSDIIGVNKHNCGGMGCEFNLSFFEFKNNNWFDITKSVIPDLYSIFPNQPGLWDINCNLPQVGLDIECNGKDLSSNVKFLWNDGQFIKKEFPK